MLRGFFPARLYREKLDKNWSVFIEN
jgi:hypothetical protein